MSQATGRNKNTLAGIVNDLESLLIDVKPHAAKSAMMGTLGNLPIPCPNPVSLLSSMLYFVDNKNRRSDYGWLYFIQSPNEASPQTDKLYRMPST
jgi:hypothetical protein